MHLQRRRCTHFAEYLNSKAETSNRIHYDSITSQPSGLESQDFFFIPPIHYAAIFHKIYGISGHSLKIQLHFHLPLRFKTTETANGIYMYICVYKHMNVYICIYTSSGEVMFNVNSDEMFIALR